MKADERRAYAQNMFARRPELFPQHRRESILAGVVLLGMTPLEVRLAAGTFYKVLNDGSKCFNSGDKRQVMWSQTLQEDATGVWMEFQNSSQFPLAPETKFRVYFERGQAAQIEQIETTVV